MSRARICTKKADTCYFKITSTETETCIAQKKSCNVIFLLTTVCRKPVQLPEFKNPWNKVKVSTHCIGSDAENDEMEVDVAVDNPERAAGTLLVDSGAGDHLFHHEFATESFSRNRAQG